MMGKGITVVWRALLLVLCLAGAAGAQSIEAPDRRDVVEALGRACPDLVVHDHAFTDAAASILHAQDPAWGRNGKRGNVNDPSHDAIAYRNPAGPGGVSIVDIIACAGGGPNCSASPAWIDQTRATIAAGTIGAWVAPSGRIPACYGGGGSGGTAPDQGSGGPSGPTPVDTLEALRAEVVTLIGELREARSYRERLEEVVALLEAAREDRARHAARIEELVDRQTRRIFGVLVEADGSMPAGIAEEAVNRLYERTSRGDRLRVRAW